MNSRQKRKLQAQQHNDARDYEKWLRNNAIYSRGQSFEDLQDEAYQKARKEGLSHRASIVLASALMLSMGAMSHKN